MTTTPENPTQGPYDDVDPMAEDAIGEDAVDEDLPAERDDVWAERQLSTPPEGVPADPTRPGS